MKKYFLWVYLAQTPLFLKVDLMAHTVSNMTNFLKNFKINLRCRYEIIPMRTTYNNMDTHTHIKLPICSLKNNSACFLSSSVILEMWWLRIKLAACIWTLNTVLSWPNISMNIAQAAVIWGLLKYLIPRQWTWTQVFTILKRTCNFLICVSFTYYFIYFQNSEHNKKTVLFVL